MPKNEDGEFEVVLGNRQLLSVFFIVVILFGVFFTMGYIVGRNSAPAVAAAPAPARTETAEARTPAVAVQPAPVFQPPAPASQPAPQTPPPPRVTRTEAATEPAPAVEKPKPEPPKREPPAPKPAADPEPGPGRLYLQVAAVGRPEAELEVNTLKKRGFPAHVGPGPREGIFRVLVGPYKTAADAARIKAELEGLGFKPYVRK
jgi:cell division septation protein DedD